MKTTEFIRQTQREAELLGFELEPPEYFDRLDPQSQNVIAGEMHRELEKLLHSQFIQNVCKGDVYVVLKELHRGCNRDRLILVSRPLQTHRHSVKELVSQGMVGLYDRVQTEESK